MTPIVDLIPILLILAALLAFVAVGVMRVKKSLRERQAQPPRPPVDVPPEEAELTEGPVSACMRCGATGVRAAALSEGGIPGAGSMLFFICPRCGHRGPPLEFEDVTAYRQFVKGLHEERS